MDKKNYESYEEIHRKLAEAMQEACISDESGDYQVPEVDLSFLNEDHSGNKGRKISLSRFAKVSAIVIILLLGMNAVMLYTDSGDSYSEKGLLHRIHEGARGIFTDSEDMEVEVDETGKVWTFSDEAAYDDAEELWEGILVPEYIPDEFKLDSLIVECDMEENYKATYTYSNDNELFYITIFNIDDGEGKASSNNYGEIIEGSDRTVHVYLSSVNKNYVTDIYFEEVSAQIYGDLSIEEMKNIALSMK